MNQDPANLSPQRISFTAGKTEFHFAIQDCVQGMRNIPDQSVDVVVTSPPYNLGIKYATYEDRRTSEEYLQWSVQWTTEVRRVLKDDGSFFLNVGACPSNPLAPHELVVELRKLFVLQNTFHWIKSISVETRDGETISAGHFKPLQSKRFVNDCHEYVFHLTKTGSTPLDRLAVGVPYSDKSNIARWKHTGGGDKRCRGNNWFIPYKTINSRLKDRPHPATFPVELASNCLKVHGLRPNLVVLEPFLGIGHCAQAAVDCGVKTFWGFDIDAEYVQVARNVLTDHVANASQELGKKSMRRTTPPSAGQDSLFTL